MRILLIEDEKTLVKTIKESLRRAGYEVDATSLGQEGLALLEVESYDLLVLDLNLPDLDGMDLLKSLRAFDKETKVLVLSARSQIQDIVEGLDAGANDYLQKPFHLDELKARIRSLTRRQFIQEDTLLSYGEICLNTKTRKAKACNQPLSLTRKETGILEYLLLHQGRPISQEELIDHVWDGSVDPMSNSIRVHISSLRKKLKTSLGYDPIENRVGIGYLLVGGL